MKRFLISIIVFLFLTNLLASENEEFRSIWVITWEHISSSRSVDENKAHIRIILDNLQKANMNAVLWHARQSGTAYYNSSFEPWGYYAGNIYPGYDPLEYVIEEAHKRGMEVHAWFNVFQASSTEPGAPAYEHPEWVCRDQDGNPMSESRALSPGLEAVRDYTLNVAMEIVNNYDIDGLHLDYVRWNEYYSSAEAKSLAKPASYVEQISLLDGQITEDEINRIKENQSSRYLYDFEHPFSAGIPTGFTTWEDWWRWSVTEFVKSLHDSIQAVKPWVRLSAAALGKYRWSGWQGYGVVYQDAGLWFNENYVDQLTPMHYHWTTGSGFYDMLNGGHEQSWIYYIQPGVDKEILYSVGPGSYVLADNGVWSNHKQIVESCRTIDWVDGFQFFSYGSWADYNYWEEAGNSFFSTKTKIRAAKFLADLTPDAPSISLLKIDSLQYEINVLPEAITDNHWFAIYRSTNDILETDQDEIVRIHFGKDPFVHQDIFSGTQDYNGQYHYFATMLDRYWNESSPSNSYFSEAIPSFAPEIVSTYPLEGDTILITDDLKIDFSKTMNPESFTNNLQLSPTIAIESLQWSNYNKTLTIKVTGNFAYATNYSLTIKKEVTDVNAKELNGNPDIPGSEDFQLNFRTIAEDFIGPKISFSNPALNEYIENYDIDETVTIAFDELIDAATVNTNTVYLRNIASVIETKMLVNTVNDKSVISIQPTSLFLPFYDYSVYLSKDITDTAGNLMGSDMELYLKTEPYAYSETIMIDDLKSSGTGIWEDPDYSGSTMGTVPPNTTFGYSKAFYLPNFSKPLDKSSAEIAYQWDVNASDFLLREYLSGGAARDIRFDTTYTLQCYVYGDRSKNYFRFSLREVEGQGYALEVSNWQIIDWVGWRIIEWDLSDPNSVGSWLGNEIMDGKEYYIDSFQLTHEAQGAISGKIYLRNLRLVKKQSATDIERDYSAIPDNYELRQNYPNPFNPTTKIDFAIPEAGFTSLSIFDLLGREVQILLAKELVPGKYTYTFDGSGLASGSYFYVLKSGKVSLKNRMILVK